MKGIEIARKLKISTSALRHYEAWGLIPKVERSANGYRNYTKEHEAYFQCIRAMNAGFGMNLIRKVMPLIRKGEILDALWLINRAQVNLHTEKEAAQRTIDMLDLKELTDLPKYRNKKTFTIGEVAKEANVAA
ncbi:Mercuric resistance operon regulatory protein [Chlamydia abortus]|nr:Mercuric resistance operon regulatory protein [Chlamydia abortus]